MDWRPGTATKQRLASNYLEEHDRRLASAARHMTPEAGFPGRNNGMLPTPDTSHVDYGRVYEPAEDSFLLLDTLSSAEETAFLHDRFGPRCSEPSREPGGSRAGSRSHPAAIFVLEVGTGSGVVIGFVAAQARALFGGGGGGERRNSDKAAGTGGGDDESVSVLCAGVDLNRFACRATAETVRRAQLAEEAEAEAETREGGDGNGPAAEWLDCVQGDLVSAWRPGCVDVLIFNPPYVPTPELPQREREEGSAGQGGLLLEDRDGRETSFEEDSFLLSLSYAGGKDGMETTDRLIEEIPSILSQRGCAYLLLCAQNRPDEVKERIRGWGSEWKAETVGSSGKKAGWERLQILRIWREA